MIASNRADSPQIGAIQFDEKTGRRKRYNGVQWNALCRVDDCPLASTFDDLCARHRSESFHQSRTTFFARSASSIEGHLLGSSSLGSRRVDGKVLSNASGSSWFDAPLPRRRRINDVRVSIHVTHVNSERLSRVR